MDTQPARRTICCAVVWRSSGGDNGGARSLREQVPLHLQLPAVHVGLVPLPRLPGRPTTRSRAASRSPSPECVPKGGGKQRRCGVASLIMTLASCRRTFFQVETHRKNQPRLKPLPMQLKLPPLRAFDGLRAISTQCRSLRRCLSGSFMCALTVSFAPCWQRRSLGGVRDSRDD